MNGDLAYGVGRTVNEFRGEGGAVAYEGKYVLVWRRIGGEWRVVHYGVSSDQASPLG